MSLLMRTALLQARVTPDVKLASEHVLRQIGLNMTEAMELFLRRVIIDQRIPFEVIALDDATLASAATKATRQASQIDTANSKRQGRRVLRE